MICSKRRPVNWVRGAALALIGYCGVVFVSSASQAQYPGSAGDLSGSALGASSSASYGSGNGSSSSSANSSANSSEGQSSDSYTDDFTTESDSYDGRNGPDGHGVHGNTTVAALSTLPANRTLRKRALIRQFRLEFAKTLIIETATKRPLHALYANVYLDQFSKEINAGLDQRANLKSLSRDLGLMRDALNDRIDKVIASYGGHAPSHSFFSKTGSGGETATALRTEVQKLKFKHELLAFGEYSLQAMGYFTK